MTAATRTDAIVRAIVEEAEKRRAVLDAPDPPQVVAVLVYLSRGGKPVRVTCEPKWSRDLEERR
jgi:hypothetical protein